MQLFPIPAGSAGEEPVRFTSADVIRFWVIASITISILGITYIAMGRGYGTIVPQLFYFPILYATYFYPRYGTWVAGACAAAYLAVAAVSLEPDPFVVSGVIFQAFLFLALAILSGWIIRRHGERRFVILDDDLEIIHAMIRNGETGHVEFKRSTLWSTGLNRDEIATSDSSEVKRYGGATSKFIIARAIAGFLNGDGGDLLIGIEEDRRGNSIRIAGLEDDYEKMHAEDRNPDGYRRMIVESVLRKYLPEVFDAAGRLLSISFPVVSGRAICHIRILPSDKPVFVSTGTEEIFFIRTDATTRPLAGKSMSDYILSRFVHKE